jgi:RNA polymerase sigma factor (sigma-70 family)
MTTESWDAQERFTGLVRAHHAAIRAYVRRRVPPTLVDDLVAETFLAAWRNFSRIEDDSLIWLYGIARGIVANGHRGQARQRQLAERLACSLTPLVVEDHAELIGATDAFAAAFAELSESEQEVLRLAILEGLGSSEGARVLRCSPAAFKVRLHRARRRLRYLLDELDQVHTMPLAISRGAQVVAVHAPIARAALAILPEEAR